VKALARRHGALALLVLLVVAGALIAQGAAAEGPRGIALSSADSDAQGALALASWLQEIGYRVSRDGVRNAQVAFVLEPVRAYDLEEARGLLAWVEAGGTLVYVPSRLDLPRMFIEPGRADHLQQALGLQVKTGQYVDEAEGWEAFFKQPYGRRFQVRTFRRLESSDNAWLPIITSPGTSGAIALTRQMGAGRIYATSAESLLDNAGIGQWDNRSFVLNILARQGGQNVGFEQDHHSLIGRPQLIDVARSSPWGWGVAYAALVTFLFLLWGGRRFGPVLAPDRPPARGTGEYATAFAGLLQRARAAGWAQTEYARIFRTRLARRLGASPDVPAERLAGLYGERYRRDPGLIADPLQALEGRPLGERALLSQVRQLEMALADPSAKG